MTEGTDISAVLPPKPQKVKVYGVDSEGNQTFICEANVCEEIPSGMGNLMEMTMEDIMKGGKE